MMLENMQIYYHGSNNILGIEYIKAILSLKSKVIPYTIKRNGPDYNSLDEIDDLASATAIREKLKKDKDVSKLMPKNAYKILNEQNKYGKAILDLNAYEKEILYKFRIMSVDEIKNLQDVSEGLENKIKDAANSCNELEAFISKIKSKRYPRARIQRICLYGLLNITKKDVLDSYKVTPYVRVLGFNQNGKMLLSRTINKNKKFPVITSVKKFMDNSNNKIYKNMLEKDILATNVYTLGYGYDSKANLDYTQKLIINN
ncbi:MAG: nucleotidyltransferase family protein [Clostridiales bacterium]|nr:nucleotidyltransferase family protein [Clostridiales bacterium]